MKTRPSKYGAKRTVVDGVTFHSQKEATRYAELKLLEKAGEIRGLKLQPEYELLAPNLHPRGDAATFYLVGKYRADFFYWTRDGNRMIEDVKGFDTPLSKWKRRHYEAQYGITIALIR